MARVAAKFSSRSKRYKDLEKELKLLRRQLLPARFDPTGLYPEHIYTKTISYRVLSHAEFEAYLEDRVWDLALTAIKTWETNGTMSKTVTCLLAFSGLSMENPPNKIACPPGTKKDMWDEKLKLAKKVAKAMNAFHYMIDTNHGIKEENILKMLLPVGVEASEIDNLWLSTIDSFGTLRGNVAHSSRLKYRTTHIADPQQELSTVEKILLGFRDIDTLLNKLIP